MLLLYTFGSTDAYQLLKLPRFVQHYLIHKQQNNNLTLADFFQIHYTSPLVIDDDFDKDMQLPFKTTETAFSQTMNIIIPLNNYTVQATPAFSNAGFLIYNEVVPSFLNDKSIFQPPRVA